MLMPILQVQMIKPIHRAAYRQASPVLNQFRVSRTRGRHANVTKSTETLGSSSKLFRHNKGLTACSPALSVLCICVSVISLTSFMCRYPVVAFIGPAMLIFLSSNAVGQPVRIGPDKRSLYDPVVSMAKVGFLLLSVLRSLV